METAIVYYSLEGNTEYAAEKIKSEIGGDLIKISPKKAYPTGSFKKFIWGGKSAVMAETPELEEYSFDAGKYDAVILGFPIWASNIAPPIRTFVKENDLGGKIVAAFACESGSGAEKAFLKLAALPGIEKLAGELILIDPKEKPSPKNDEKIKEFCDVLRESEEK